MARQVGTGVIVSIGVGFALLFVSKSVARMGDIQFTIDGGVGALPYHASALAMLVAALVAFAVGAMKLYNGVTKPIEPVTPVVARAAPSPRRVDGSPTPTECAPSEFDADAALARYLANKAVAPVTVDATLPVAQPRRAAGFGRKTG